MYRKAADIAPNPATAYRAWALAARNHLNDEDCAMQMEWERAQSSPEIAQSFFGKSSRINVDEACYTYAEDRFHRAAHFDVQPASTHNSWGILYVRRGDHDRAIEQYTKATRADNRYAFAWINWGLILQNEGSLHYNLDEAAAKFRRAANVDPSNAVAFEKLGHVLVKLGKTKEAMEAYQHAIKLNPKNESLSQVIARLKDNKD